MKNLTFFSGKYLFSIWTILMVSYSSFAQTPYYKLFNTPPNGSWGRCVVGTPDGNYLLSGNTDYQSGSTKTTLIKINPGGDTLWSKSYSFPNYDTELLGMSSMPDSSCILFGLVSGSAPGYVGKNYNFVLHLNYFGDTISTKVFGIPYSGVLSQSVFRYMKKTSTGSLIFSGFESLPTGNCRATLGESDLSGNVLWLKKYIGQPLDSNYIYTANDLIQNGDGTIISLVVLQDGTSLPRNHAVVKTDGNGNIIWARKYNMQLNNIFKGPNNGYLVTGFDYDFYPEPMCIMNFDSLGYFISMHNYSSNLAGIMKPTSDHGFVVYGEYYPNLISPTDSIDALISKVDSSGNVSWIYRYDDSTKFDRLTDVWETPDKGFIAIGKHGSGDITLLSFDSTGISPCLNHQTLPYTTAVNVISDTALVMSVGSANNVVYPAITFSYAGTINESNRCSSLSIYEPDKVDVDIYPNPFSETLHVNTNFQQFSVLVTDVYGRKSHSFKSISKNNEFNLSGLPDGIYFITLQHEGQSITQKIVKLTQ